MELKRNEFPFIQIIDAVGENVCFSKCPTCDHKVIIVGEKGLFPKRVDQRSTDKNDWSSKT